MKSKSKDASDDGRREIELDYSKAHWGKHNRRILKEGSNIVLLDPDIAKRFRNSEAVNEALRSLLHMTDLTRRVVGKVGNRK